MTNKAGEQPTITQALDALIDKRAKLVDDVLYYSGNENAGYAQIRALDAEIVKHVVANRTTSLAAQDGLRRKMERAELAFAAIKSSHAKSSSAYKIASETLAYLLQPENDTALSAIKGDKS